jgi:hypothetical protein
VLLAAVISSAAPRRKSSVPLFQTSDRCLACHNGITTASGEDVSIGYAWRPTMMANSSRDPYWQAAVRREITDHPASREHIEDECSKCHAPMARYDAWKTGGLGQVFAHLPFDGEEPRARLAADGVSCSLCHQIGKEKLGTPDSFTGGFTIDPPDAQGLRPEYGPFKIEAGIQTIMRSSSGGFRPTESEHIRQSEVCATCHTLITKALGPDGQAIGSLHEQMPYQEWLQSGFRNKESCQDCHMPVIREEVPVTRVLGTPREGVARHVFVGGNFFMLRMLNRYRGELSVQALPVELDAAAARTIEHLKTKTARLSIETAVVQADRLEIGVVVANLGGHKFPTAYPSRRAWMHVAVRDSAGKAVFESGAFQRDGSIEGNDNDADSAGFEPHHTVITDAGQVQIYESIMSDRAGKSTTALLAGVGYLKDNRLLPAGFEKRSAPPEVTVIGGAAQDADFAAPGDRVRYSVALGESKGPWRVDAELWFQPISYRWASNLRAYDAAETKRFVGYYDAMAADSAVIVGRASAEASR